MRRRRYGRAVVGHLVDVRPAIVDAARGGLDLADQRLDQRRLAAAGGADEEDELAAVDVERDAVERDVATGVDDGRVVDRDDRRLAARTRLAAGLRLTARVIAATAASAL